MRSNYKPITGTQFIGQHVIYEAVCASTNTLALTRLYQEALPEGTVFITNHQHQGRGQRNHTWYSAPYQNLTFSVVLYPTFLKAQQSFSLNIITTLALCEVLADYLPKGVAIKWPNDVYYQHRKLSGVLIENIVAQQRLKASVVGIGLNINQLQFNSEWPTSLSKICGTRFSLPCILSKLLIKLEHNYVKMSMQGMATLQAHYLQRMYWIHEGRTFQDKTGTFQGKISGIDMSGRLTIERSANLVSHYRPQELTFIA